MSFKRLIDLFLLLLRTLSSAFYISCNCSRPAYSRYPLRIRASPCYDRIHILPYYPLTPLVTPIFSNSFFILSCSLSSSEALARRSASPSIYFFRVYFSVFAQPLVFQLGSLRPSLPLRWTFRNNPPLLKPACSATLVNSIKPFSSK